jgi:hypothetical protein
MTLRVKVIKSHAIYDDLPGYKLQLQLPSGCPVYVITFGKEEALRVFKLQDFLDLTVIVELKGQVEYDASIQDALSDIPLI